MKNEANISINKQEVNKIDSAKSWNNQEDIV